MYRIHICISKPDISGGDSDSQWVTSTPTSLLTFRISQEDFVLTLRVLLILCPHGSKGNIIHLLSGPNQKPGYLLEFSFSLSLYIKSLSLMMQYAKYLKPIYLFPPSILND